MKKVLLLLLIVLVVFSGVVVTRPNTFHIERSATVPAAPGAVFAQIDDFHNWVAWSPWEHLDPSMTKTFGGAASGVGATYHWTGNDKVGEGNMSITESSPSDKIVIQLDFIKPFASSSVTTFTLAPVSDGTRVTWAMDGRNNLMAKVMCLFMSMDKMVGPDFEKGLAALTTATQAGAAPADSAAAPASH